MKIFDKDTLKRLALESEIIYYLGDKIHLLDEYDEWMKGLHYYHTDSYADLMAKSFFLQTYA